MSLLRLSAILGFLGVALGAFGAHGLRARVGPEMVEVWKTGVLYHLVHALALLGVALAGERIAWRRVVAGLFIAGLVVFSGSLYRIDPQRSALAGRRHPAGWGCLPGRLGRAGGVGSTLAGRERSERTRLFSGLRQLLGSGARPRCLPTMSGISPRVRRW